LQGIDQVNQAIEYAVKYSYLLLLISSNCSQFRIAYFSLNRVGVMRRVIITVLCSSLGFFAGCVHMDRYLGNVYEGLKAREAIVHPSLEQKPAEKSMSYQKYKAEREKLLESSDGK